MDNIKNNIKIRKIIVEAMKGNSRSKIESKIKTWLQEVKAKGYDISDYKFRFEDNKLRFYVDGELYDIIEDYFSDGFEPELGAKFGKILSELEGECYSKGIYEFYRVKDDLNEETMRSSINLDDLHGILYTNHLATKIVDALYNRGFRIVSKNPNNDYDLIPPIEQAINEFFDKI